MNRGSKLCLHHCVVWPTKQAKQWWQASLHWHVSSKCPSHLPCTAIRNPTLEIHSRAVDLHSLNSLFKSQLWLRGVTHPRFQAINIVVWSPLGFPGGASGKEPTYQCRRPKRHGFNPWVGKIPWRRAWQPTPVFLPGESHGQGSLAGYSPWGHKESDMTEATMHAWQVICQAFFLEMFLKILFREDLRWRIGQGKEIAECPNEELTLTECSQCAVHWSKMFLCTNLFNHHSIRMFPSYRWGNWSAEKRRDLPKVTKSSMSRWSASSEDWAPRRLHKNIQDSGGGREMMKRQSEVGGHQKQPHLHTCSVED